ncbi:MAG: MarR family winged helix-turn-helix transcriptional regulator [Frankiaceae bacterium]|nr:MarR family winged helix-turn-helix transcriptional regulator [Frankiaceae bacterium]
MCPDPALGAPEARGLDAAGCTLDDAPGSLPTCERLDDAACTLEDTHCAPEPRELDNTVCALPPRWLDDEEQAAWRGFLALVRHITIGTNKQLHEDGGLPHGYYQILAMLSEADNRTLRMTQLAEVTMTSQSRISHAIKALEARGWVTRCPVEADRRGHAAVLTDSGLEALVAMAPSHAAQVRRLMFDRLSRDQVGQLRQIAAAVVPPADLP